MSKLVLSSKSTIGILIFLGLFPSLASAQGVWVQPSPATTVVTISGTANVLVTVPFATITVCQFASAGTPCSPLAPLCTDSTCAVQSTGLSVFTADAFGNFGFWISPGNYKFQIASPGVQTQTYNLTASPSSITLSTLSGNLTFTGNNTHSGSEGFSGPVSFTGSDTHSGSEAFAKINNICNIDGIAITTLAQAITCAGTTGVIEVPPSAGTLVVPGTPVIPPGVTLRVDQGAVLAQSGTVTINGPLVAGPYQIFAGLGTISFTALDTVVLPEWWGAKADGSPSSYPVTGTDNLAAFNAALAALPLFPGNPTQTTYQLVNGQYARTGKILFSTGRYVVSNTWVVSPFVTYECPSFNGCFIILKDGVSVGSEVWTINVQALTGPSPNTSYGAQFVRMAVDCNSNVASGGHNSKGSGVIFNGAQGTSLGTLWIENCGTRGFWLQNSGSNTSGTGGPSDLEVLGVIIGPGAQFDAGFANFGTVRTEVVNTTGSNTDADGDPNPGLLVGSAASNGAINLNIDLFGAEFTCLPMKIWSGNAITIKNVNVGPPAGTGGSTCPTGIIVSHGANAVSLGPMFTFTSGATNLFTNFIVDRTTTPTTNISGNFQNFPSLSGYNSGGTSPGYFNFPASFGNGSTTIGTGIFKDGGGFKHKRFQGVLGGTCPTAAAIGATCVSGNLSWTTAFADTSYTATCSLVGALTGQPHIVGITTATAGVLNITIAADTAAAANVAAGGFVDCIAMHD